MGIGSWWLDAKLGARMLVKHPGLAVVGGIGIAVVVAIAAGGFSVIYGNFLPTSLPLEEGDRLVSIEIWDAPASHTERRILRDFQVWRDELKSVQELGAFQTMTPNLIVPGARPESVRVASISASGFAAARVRPLLGRRLAENDEREGAAAVVVIGESVWRARFASDPGILGRTIQLGATAYSVVGVMPAGFAFPVNHQFWTPLRVGSTRAEPLTGPELMVFGRLAPGATWESAQAELEVIARRAAEASPRTHAQLRPSVLPYPYPFLGMHEAKDAIGLHTMQGVLTALFVLVCLNVAILVYSRTATRQAEITIRTALGAARGRIVTQLFVEALVLSGGAALAGVAIAVFALRAVKSAMLPIASELPFWLSYGLMPGAALYAAGLSVLAAGIMGIVPALKATGRDAQNGLRVIGSGGAGARLGKTWTMLIVTQVGFAVALLPASVSAGWQSMREGLAGPGFAAEAYLSAELGLDSAAGATAEYTRRYAGRQTELIRRLEADPEVAGVTFAMKNPGEERGARIETETGSYEARFNRVDVNFFRVFQVPVLAGRGLETRDLAGGPVVVSRTLALKAFRGDALGRRIRHEGWHEIIGIVEDFPIGASPEMGSPLRVYYAVPAGQVQSATLLVRARNGAAATLAGRLPEMAAAVDPDLHLRKTSTLDEALRREQWIRRLEAAVLLGVAISVLMLSAAGIYALMSITVSQRRREIGIRIALGADRLRIVGGIFSRAFGQLAVGAGVGFVLGVAIERTLGAEATLTNAVAVRSGVTLFILMVGIVAALGPARRSLRIEPTEALREQ
jgi:predicted permease